jgi:hypothetical protein
VGADEAPPRITAGPEGADVAIVGFRHQPDA